jgi:hypothetical protein
MAIIADCDKLNHTYRALGLTIRAGLN